MDDPTGLGSPPRDGRQTLARYGSRRVHLAWTLPIPRLFGLGRCFCRSQVLERFTYQGSHRDAALGGNGPHARHEVGRVARW